MVSAKSIFASGILLLGSITYAMPADINGDSSPITAVKYNPETGGVEIIHGSGAEKRAAYKPPPPCTTTAVSKPKDVLTVLKEKKCTDFCKKYINIHPVVTKTVTVTSCGKANPNCLTVTQTSVVPVTQDVTNTVEAETPTVTTDVTATETGIAIVTDTTTVTSTVGSPLTTDPLPVAPTTTPLFDGNPTAFKRNVGAAIPTYLKPYPTAQISSACSQFIKAYIQTTTRTTTKTIYIPAPTASLTQTSTVATITHLTTTTPLPTTLTNTVAIVTVTETLTDPINTVTVTTTVCPSPTQGASGIAVRPPGSLQSAASNNIVECCTACYNSPGCVGWAYLGSGFCFFGSGTPPFAGQVTPQCPTGLGSFSLGLGGPPSLAGGKGPCFSG